MIVGVGNAWIAGVPHDLCGVVVGYTSAFPAVCGHVASPKIVGPVDPCPRVCFVDSHVLDVVAVKERGCRAGFVGRSVFFRSEVFF